MQIGRAVLVLLMGGERRSSALAGYLWLNGTPLVKAVAETKSTIVPQIVPMKDDVSLPPPLEIRSENPPSQEVPPSLTPKLDDECSACMNSVSHIDRHVIICDTSSWASKIEKEIGTFPALLYTAIGLAKAEAQSTLEIKLTACDQPNESPDQVEVLVYPERLKFFVSRNNEEQISSFAQLIVSPSLNRQSSFPCAAIPWRQLVLVCTHGSRDKRCGRAGPLVISAMLAELKRRGITEEELAVRGSSHIGGHKFAGTLIVYPTGQWYGYVTPKVVPELLSCIENGEVLNRCFRGRSNCRDNIDW
jgi:hypothetical protein